MPVEISLRFYEELNDYLPAGKRKRAFAFSTEGRSTVRKVLQQTGVPESEVELILVNGVSVGLLHFLEKGDRVSIYPVFESLDVQSLIKIRREPLRRIRFVVDAALDRLGSELHALGFDVAVESGDRASEIAEEEKRILLTTDRALPKPGLSRVFVVSGVETSDQLQEVLSRLSLPLLR